MWTVWIKDQTARSVQSDLDLRCPQKLLVSSTVRKELTITFHRCFFTFYRCFQSPNFTIRKTLNCWVKGQINEYFVEFFTSLTPK